MPTAPCRRLIHVVPTAAHDPPSTPSDPLPDNAPARRSAFHQETPLPHHCSDEAKTPFVDRSRPPEKSPAPGNAHAPPDTAPTARPRSAPSPRPVSRPDEIATTPDE